MWIKCSERLPTKENYYLAWNESGFAQVLSWCDGWNCHRRYTGEIYREGEIKTVVAWQPIEQFKE